MYLATPTWVKSLTKFNLKYKILSMFRTWPVGKERTEQINFFNWLSNLKKLVLSNGFKNVRNVIQTALKQNFVSKFAQRLGAWPASVRRMS